jgi:cell division protein FtsA
MKKGRLIVGLDVGTTKTCVVVGEVGYARDQSGSFFPRAEDDLDIDIIGAGISQSTGLKRGTVVNIEKTAESIRMAVKEVETTAGIEIRAAHVSIAGEHIDNFLSHGVIAVRDREINEREIEKVIDAAKAVAFPVDREMLHVIPLGFAVDGQNGINDPRGMSGVRLETDVQIITGSVTPVQNLIKSCHRAGLEVIDVVFEPLATAEAVLTQEEMALGVGLIDLGGGTTNITLFHEGNICYHSVLNVGGNNFTNDIAIGLRTPVSEAERIKKTHGCVLMTMVKNGEELELTYSGNRPRRRIPREHLIEVLQPRAEELLYLIKEEIIKSGFYGLLTSGIVLTGGTAMMHGMDIMAENIFELPVRIGAPQGFRSFTDSIYSPVYSTGVGLVFYGARETMVKYRSNGGILRRLIGMMRGWTEGIFR